MRIRTVARCAPAEDDDRRKTGGLLSAGSPARPQLKKVCRDGSSCAPHGCACVAKEQLCALYREPATTAHHNSLLLLPALLQLDAQRLQCTDHVPDVLAVLHHSKH